MMAIIYTYRFSKVLGFISTEGGGNNVPGDPYSYFLP